MDGPTGFSPHFRKTGLTDPWEPIYSRAIKDAVLIGLRAGPAHSNSRDMVHGGLLTTLADNAMGLSCAQAIAGEEKFSLVTVGLAIDFIAPAMLGEWIEVRPVVLTAKRGLCVVTATIHADDTLCARANATFRAASARPT